MLLNESVENAADVLMKECVQRFPRSMLGVTVSSCPAPSLPQM